MTWTVRSRTDPDRWLESAGGIDFTADPQTTEELGDLAQCPVRKWPGGPLEVGVTTPLDLLGAACETIPSAKASGDYPQGPEWPTHGGLLVY